MFTDTRVFSAYAVDDLVQDERGITRGDGPFIAAWFKDPAGNILEVLQERASPESVARAIFDAIEKEEEDIFPDPMSQSVAEGWRNSAAKALERQLAALAQGIRNGRD